MPDSAPTRLIVALLVGCFVLDPLSAAFADDVYRWIDEQGVVHFSQWPPKPDVSEVSTVYIASSTPDDYDPSHDPYSVLNQSARIHLLWADLQERKEESREEIAKQSVREVAATWERDHFFSASPFSRLSRFRDRDPFSLPRKQLEVLDEFARLPIPDAVSINSSWHRQRVTGQRRVFQDAIRGSKVVDGH